MTPAAILSAAIASANPVTPQIVPAPGDQAIVVTGERETRKTVEQFVRSLTPTIWQGQISRFEHSVCPAVYGLAKAQADAVTNRMRAIARNVGIVVEGSHCGPNVLLIVTGNKRALLEELERHRGEIFGGMPRRLVREMERDPSPAAAWQLRGRPISASGMDLRWDAKLGAWMNYTTDAASHITEGSRPQFDGAVVVIERKALAGLTVTQLADYAAIRALTGADPAKLGNSGAPTILHVLDVPMGGETPITMTKWDLAFLKGFYDVHRNMRANAQRSEITDSMEKTIQKLPEK
jgi:hypothetical protein